VKVSLVLVALLVAGSGCLQGAPVQERAREPDYGGVPADALEAGRFYAFDHDGGRLAFRLEPGGAARVELYDSEDRRVARVPFGEGTETGPEVAFDLAAGRPVVRFEEMNGTVAVASDGRPVDRFEPLGVMFERIVVAARPPEPLRLPLVPSSEPLEVESTIRLATAPHALRLLASGSYDALEFVAWTDSGVVLEAADAYVDPFGALLGEGLHTVPGDGFPENMESAELGVRLHAEGASGVFVLEAWGYSRAEPLRKPAQATTRPVYEYGAVPDRPALFDVHAEATRITFRADGDAPATVVLFGPDDARIGTYRVQPGDAVAVPVQGGGAYVAVALHGSIIVGADAAPADLDSLHPLERIQTTAPTEPPGQDGAYGVVEENVTHEGVLYDIGFGYMGGTLPGFPCGSGSTVRVLQDGQVLGFWGDEGDMDDGNRSARLRDGPVTVVADGFEGCGHAGAVLWSYVRP